MALSVVMLMLLVVVMVGTVQGQAPPTGLSAVHTTSTTIHVYWSPPTSMPTGYEITYFAGAEDVTGTAVPVSGGSTNNREIYSLSATITYRVSIVSLNGITRSVTTGPVMAARGPGLALKGAVLPNHSVLRRDPSVIGEDDDAVYCVTDDVTCCGTPPSPSDGGSGNGQGYWIFPDQLYLPSSTAKPWLWYARWLTGAVLMNFRGTATTGATGLHRCEVQDSTGTLHQFYTCIYGYNTDTHQCVVRITDPLQFSLQTTPTADPPVFTLTCVSTSGPATTVTWTRDGTAVPYDFDHVHSQTVADQHSLIYINVLTVTGNEPGNYLCSVTNVRTALPATASLTVAAAETPSNITVNRVTPTATSITVSWSVPSTGAIPTGYIVHYLASGDKGSTIINSGTTTMVTITVLSTELVYEITLQTLSDMLPSAKSMTITIGMVFEPIQFNLISSLDAESPVFVLTCNSTSVFPVTYTWMRNGSALIANENHIITKERAACCDWTVSTLKVIGRYNGNYKCTVHSFEHSQSREFTVKLWILLNPPTVISAIKDGASGIRVCWTPPLPRPTRGYKIYYRADGELSKKVEIVPSISAQDWRITSGIQNGVDYLITMVAVGDNNYESIAVGPVLAARSPGVVLLGKLLKNNSVISHSNIGTNDKAVYCVVNDARCCAGSAVIRQRGNWYLPNEFQLNSTEKSDYSANHTKAAVLLNYHGDSSGVSGIFRCNILDQSNTLYTFFIGVYSENEGGLIVADTIGFSLLSAPNADPPQFNLICTSTGGPAMTVTWTRNEVFINEDNSHLFSQQIVNTRVAEYNNKLTVTGRELGVYKCSVCNSRGQSTGILRLTAPSPASLSTVHETATNIDVYWTLPVLDILTGAYPPREVKAALFGSTITVYWTPPTVGATPTGYVIYYQARGEEVESVTLNDGSLTKHNIVGVKANKVYAITMLTISHMLPSRETTPFRNEVADVFATIASINGILLKWKSIAMPIDISTNSYCFTVYYTVASEGGELMSESTISASGNTTSFDIAVSELAPGLQHQFQVSITLLRGGQKIEGERSIVTKQSTVVFDQAYFQLQIGPLEHPGTWSFARGIKMEHVIRMEVATVIRRRCRCSFPLEYLRIGKLSCRSTFQQIVWVTYRSIVVALPSLSVTSLDLVQHIQAWVASNTTLCADPFILDVNPSCRVGVASLGEPECRSSSQGGN